MDQNEGKGISLVFQSPYFTDIDSIISNRTSSVELPKTTNNLMAVDYAHLAGTDALFEYNKHKVIYKRDGVQLFSGTATLLSITPTSLKFSFVWGNVGVFKALLDTKLRDLQTDDDYIVYDSSGVNASANKDYFPGEWRDHSKWGNNGESIQPIMPVAKIMQRIKERFGVSINFSSGKQPFDNYYIPLTYRNADDKGRMEQGVKFSGNSMVSQQSQVISGYGLYYTRLNGVVVGDFYNDNGIIDTSGFGKIRVKFCKGFSISRPRLQSWSAGFWVGTVNDNGTYYQRIKSPKYTRTTDESGNNYIYTITEDYIVTLDKQYSNIVIAVSDSGGESKKPTILATSDIYVYDAALEELEFGKGSLYPLYRNLPDWSVSQLIKNLMKLEGVFAYSNDDTTINFATIGDLYSNRISALDWSDKLIDIEKGPTERSVSFNDLAKKNWCRYAEDDNVQSNYDGYIRSNGVDIEEENDLIELDFAPTQSVNTEDIIECWKTDDNGNVEWNEVTPRILHLAYSKKAEKEIVTFSGLDWRTLLNNRYANYQNIVEYPRTIKASVQLSLYDILQLDMRVPVYSKQWGHYYAITKLTTKENGVADVELLQLGKATIYSTFGGTSGEEVEQYELGAMPLGNGSYYIDLKGKTTETIESLIANNDYHLALIRYGYARRGRKGKKIDRLYGEIGTHTAYTTQYKKYRGGERFRIIGHDILKRVTREGAGTTPLNDYLTGTTKQLDAYANSTLIFEFGDTVVLPPMKTHKKIVSRNGHICNTSARGMADLYVGLIKRYKEGDPDEFNLRSYGWTCVSNLLQVRGLHSDHLGWWEFEESNIKGVEDI